MDNSNIDRIEETVGTLADDGAGEAEKEARERRRKRREEAKREKEKQQRIRKTLKIALPCAAAVIVLTGVLVTAGNVFGAGKAEQQSRQETEEAVLQEKNAEETQEKTDGEELLQADALPVKEEAPKAPAIPSYEQYRAMLTADTKDPGEKVISGYAVLMNADTGEILAQREGMTRINPASMTKILTVLVAAEQVENLDEMVTITREITDYSYSNDCSIVGFAENETVPVRDLFYGTILPSGADAAAALAIHTAGSLENFVELMNEKLEELGLSETSHMTNCVGLYDKEHYSTVYDMALILKAAIENEVAREALTAHVYTTSSTEEHPDGITVSNWFLRRIEDKDTNGEVWYAKTGFVNQSGSCAASYELGNDQVGYICVTADAYSSWRCIYDHVELYQMCVGKQAALNGE